MSRDLAEAQLSSAALQRVLKSVETEPNVVFDSKDFQVLGPMMQRMVVGQMQRKALPQLRALSPNGGGWWPIVHEAFSGAWQRNVEVTVNNALSYYAVYSCVRLISTDIAKLSLRLVEQTDDMVWVETSSPSFSPVLRQPNHYQTINQYVEQYMLSKLLSGNAYVLKRRDNRGVVTALYPLDSSRVTPMVTADGAIWYELKRDDLSGLTEEKVTVPASEIIHDTYIAPFHPLIGLTPLYACALPVLQGLNIQTASNSFFTNGANPGGMLTAPGAINQTTVDRLLATVAAKKPGDTLVAGDGLTFEKFTMSAVDSQLIEQLRMTAEQVCGAFGVPPYLVDIGPPPPYANFEPLLLKYHSQCIQSLTTNFEKAHDKGIGLIEKVDGRQLGYEFDIDDLIWMDTATRVESAQKAMSGGLSPDEVRKRYHGVGSTAGGNTVYMQEQNWPLRLLSQRELPTREPTAPASLPAVAEEDDDMMDRAAAMSALHRKSISEGLYAA